MSRRLPIAILLGLLLIQAAQVLVMLRGESLTLDEADHSYAGYRMWHDADYAINPEHPPLVKLVATLPLLGRQLWLPPIEPRHFKLEAYLGGRDFWEHNDGPSQTLFLRVRLAVLVFALGMTVAVFLFARELFGTQAALLAATLTTFEPTLLAHSGRVTTDMGLVCFLLFALLAFYRFVRRSSWPRLLLTALATGCVLGTKHSGILLVPMLLILAVCELRLTRPSPRARVVFGGLAVVFSLALVILWSLYGFRFAMRPPDLAIVPSFEEYLNGLSPAIQMLLGSVWRWHLLPQSYLMGLVDIKQQEAANPAFLLGTNYPHGVWWYFPTALTIKSTLGLMGLLGLAVFAVVTRRLRQPRELLYLVIPGAIYLAVSMANRMNIGIRHVLFLYPLAAILAAAGACALLRSRREWLYAIAAIAGFHIVSSLLVFPHYLAYANEAWGGPSQVHTHLSDSSVDWGQQFYSVKRWVDAHPNEPCWFAYVGRPYLHPEAYGIHCQPLPNIGTAWIGEWTDAPTVIHGNLLISADNLEGCEWPDAHMNPYDPLRRRPIAEQIDYGVMVFRGEIPVPQVAALSAAQQSQILLARNEPQSALGAARRAVQLDPNGFAGQIALAEAATALDDKLLAREAYRNAILLVRQMNPGTQDESLPGLLAKLTALDPAPKR